MTADKNAHPPVAVQQFGQSIWLDYIHRRDLENGELARRIAEDGVLGMTSNPTIFQKAIGDSEDYDAAIQQILELDPEVIYEKLAIEDIQRASDLLRPVYERTGGKDGYVSLEVSPFIAHNTEKTVAEAKRLFAAVNRPNLMIKIPATPAGLPAIEAVIASGINVNVTLIFAVSNYLEVAEAYIRGLERRLEAGEAVDHIASVASFFVSRIDTMIDSILENNIRAAQMRGDTGRIAANRQLLGQVAIANAKIAYKRFRDIFYGKRFAKLRDAGAQVQRPLWASTGTKNPAYPDTKYVDALIGEDTVNTVPPKTLDAFKHHGYVGETITRQMDGDLPPDVVMDLLAEVGIELKQITQRLQDDGVEAFAQSFEQLIDQVAAKRLILSVGIKERQKLALGISVDSVQRAIKDLDDHFVNGRIWSKDGSLWKNHGPTIQKIQQRLGWLDVLETIDLQRLKAIQADIKDSLWETIVLLGMGGSSLAPEVLYQTFGKQEGYPDFVMLDSTDPIRVKQVEASITLDKSLFIVASKSGGTVETWSFYKYFYELTGGRGDQFIAITDAGSQLEAEARQKGFRDIFLNPSDIGGRYSALSYFGLVPAALIGLDLERLWASAQKMIAACGANIPGKDHPGITLGAVIGALAKEGRDKMNLFCSQSIATFGNWVEQLVAESLGKEGKGVLPIVGATIGKPHDYATDRLFIYLRVDEDADTEQMDEGIRILREAGHPRVTLRLPDAYAIAGEFFRWEFATAVAGQMLGVNPFDEPNVAEAKEATQQLLRHYQEHGQLPQIAPIMSQDGVSFYSNDATLNPLRELCRSHGYDSNSMVQVLGAQIAGTNAGDYFALLCYFTPNSAQLELLSDIRRRIRHVTKRAVTIGYGPRYLHSTGQLHKGGPNNGVFLVLTTDIGQDIAIPEAPYSFGTLFQAQALGDYKTLHQHKVRAIRLHAADITKALEKILSATDFVGERRQ